MTTEKKVQILSTFQNRDGAGRHFCDLHTQAELMELEADGLIEIDRPVHKSSGISYSDEYHVASVTEAGVNLVESYPEFHGVSI